MKLHDEFRFLFNRLPFQVVLYPTSRCNARCPHCYNHERQSSADAGQELSLDEIEKISAHLEHVKVLTVSGGEPFLRGDLKEIVRVFRRNNGLQYLSIHTNGFLCDTIVSTVASILEAEQTLEVIVCVSIDAIGERHDEIRRHRGGFAKLLVTLEELRNLRERHGNLHLIATTMYSRSTLDSFQETIGYIRNTLGIKPSLSFIRGDVDSAREKEIDVSGYEDFFSRNRELSDRGISLFSPMALKEAMEMMICGIVVRNYRTGTQAVPCQAGRRLVVIYENGDVYPCETLGEKFGNLRDVGYDLGKLLFSPTGKEVIARIRAGRCCCTWENIIPINLLLAPRQYPRILRNWLRLLRLKMAGRRSSADPPRESWQ